ncbi:hypothetical protein GCM10007103_06030 [Salinimicrobium marinum]|uniref:Transport and Golgi organisation 2 n=1 Tax=Salinimicrobium marinum TaxID=680283 RepID=A0A918S8N4_9FLAO|nr:NRDE family protein [Salinimicrobium marinum]GHA27441.1 hypothetical protein GCM10007103_06030 [Salinimicrobium marinum]
MCTITFVPTSAASKEFILTSNRDEAVDRKTLVPNTYYENGTALLFPRDALAGGTWIGLSEKKRVVCLMNGGFEKHLRKPSYAKSRGVVVKNLLAAGDLLPAFESEDLEETEPFTCIVVEWKKSLDLYQLVWGGSERHIQKLPLKNHIWASSFLYTPETRLERQQHFKTFSSGNNLTQEKIMNFHSSEDAEGGKGLIIDKGILKTCSITQVERTSEEVKMIYKDLLREGTPVFETKKYW